MTEKQYLELPAPDTHCFDEDTGKDVWSYSADQMRAYADATCAMRLGTRLIDEVLEADAIATSVCLAVSELPDRNSPQDWPEAMLVTGDELHQIVGDSVIDRQQRNRLAEPVAWRHSRTLGLFDIEEDVPLADGDEWAEPLYLHPPEAPASQDAEDALVAALIECDRLTESMRIWVGMGYHYPPPQARQIHDTARAAIDAARAQQEHKP